MVPALDVEEDVASTTGDVDGVDVDGVDVVVLVCAAEEVTVELSEEEGGGGSVDEEEVQLGSLGPQ